MRSLPLTMVGSSKYGRYPKISSERTYNFIISDNFLVPYAGHKLAAQISGEGEGRGLFNSSRADIKFVVVNNGFYSLDSTNTANFVANLETSTGDVFMDENQKNEIAICDQKNIYIYNYLTGKFNKATIDFTPGYICYQDGRFVAAAPKTSQGVSQWRLSDTANSLIWPTINTGVFQTKGDNVVAVVPFPSRGNNILVFGTIVTELWADVGLQLFPYQKNTSYNIDYGCVSPSTIAFNDSIVVWLGQNKTSGPTILYTSGGQIQQISTDGINFLFAKLNNPEDSYGFLFKQDGHLIYQLTFPTDNISLIYDFNTQQFFDVCDQYMDAHIAKRVVYSDNSYYFISFIDGNIYELNSKYSDYNGEVVPRIRVGETIRQPDTEPFVVNDLAFLLEQGEGTSSSRIDFSFSDNGGKTFSKIDGQDLNPQGYRANKFQYWVGAYTNEFTPQFRFWSDDRIVVGNGVVNIY